jgi:serine/threonine protein phosphatase 1
MPETNGRTLTIGDVHGCRVALDALLAAIDVKPADRLVFLGDIIDRGSDSKGVIDRLIELEAKCRLVVIRGNHEEMLLDAREDREAYRFWQSFGGEEMLESYGPRSTIAEIPPAHWSMIERSVTFLETDRHIFVHASYWPNVPIVELSTNVLRWESLEPQRMKPHFSGKTVIVGHTPQADGNIIDLGFLVGIDTNCCRGGWLTALDVSTGLVLQSNEQGALRQSQRVRR